MTWLSYLAKMNCEMIWWILTTEPKQINLCQVYVVVEPKTKKRDRERKKEQLEMKETSISKLYYPPPKPFSNNLFVFVHPKSKN